MYFCYQFHYRLILGFSNYTWKIALHRFLNSQKQIFHQTDKARATIYTCKLILISKIEFSLFNLYVTYPVWLPNRHEISSPSMSFSTASEGRPVISSVFSHTRHEVPVLCASSEGFAGRQSWDMKAHVGHSSAFSSSQYSEICGSVAAKRVLLEPVMPNVTTYLVYIFQQ